MISRQVLDNGKVTSLTKCKHFGFVQRKQNASAMERGQQTNCQRTNLKSNHVEFAPGHSKCLALVRFGPNLRRLLEEECSKHTQLVESSAKVSFTFR